MGFSSGIPGKSGHGYNLSWWEGIWYHWTHLKLPGHGNNKIETYI